MHLGTGYSPALRSTVVHEASSQKGASAASLRVFRSAAMWLLLGLLFGASTSMAMPPVSSDAKEALDARPLASTSAQFRPDSTFTASLTACAEESNDSEEDDDSACDELCRPALGPSDLLASSGRSIGPVLLRTLDRSHSARAPPSA
mgnify:CR=1 FL=1